MQHRVVTHPCHGDAGPGQQLSAVLTATHCCIHQRNRSNSPRGSYCRRKRLQPSQKKLTSPNTVHPEHQTGAHTNLSFKQKVMRLADVLISVLNSILCSTGKPHTCSAIGLTCVFLQLPPTTVTAVSIGGCVLLNPQQNSPGMQHLLTWQPRNPHSSPCSTALSTAHPISSILPAA